LKWDPKLQRRIDAPADFALEYAATSAPSPELSTSLTLSMFKTSFFFAIGLQTFHFFT